MEQQSLAISRLNQDSVLAALSRHIGRNDGISIGNLVYAATGQQPCPASERHCREVIVELRVQGFAICAHPARGYYMAADTDELDECCKYLCDRAMTSLKQVAAMKKVALPDLHQQLRINI